MKLINQVAILLARLAKRRAIRIFSGILFVVILVVSAYTIVNYNKVALNDYTVVRSSEFSEYEAYNISGVIYTDPIYSEDDKLGIAIVYDKEQSSQFVEFHLYGGSLYKLDFVNNGTVVYSCFVEENTTILDIASLTDNKKYDCILIRNLMNGKCGIEYVNSLDKYEDNVVLQEIPDTKKINSITGEYFDDIEGINLPYEVQGVQAYNNGYDNGVLSIEVLNIHAMDIRLVDILDENDNVVCEFASAEVLPHNSGDLIYEMFKFDNIFINELNSKKHLYIRYVIGDNEELSITQINPFPRFDVQLSDQTIITTQDNLSEFDNIRIDNNKVEFKNDFILIDKPMFIPDEYVLQVNEGQRIDLVNGAFIVARNAVEFNGSEKKPITVLSSDGSGKGLFVCQAKEKSTVNYTVFDGLNTPDAGAWILTGAVTFYESNVELRNSAFINNVCEDALNLVRCDFVVDQCLFENTFGDAFDADFCTGEFVNNSFINTGNDGFDVSTSIINVDNVHFENIGDKAISGGEKSTLVISDIEIENTIIGLASKDSTLITGNNIYIKNAEIGITLYQKKPEYTGAYIDIEDVIIKGDIGIDYLIQEESELIIDHEIVEPKSLAKENILFERMIKGLSITEFEEQQ